VHRLVATAPRKIPPFFKCLASTVVETCFGIWRTLVIFLGRQLPSATYGGNGGNRTHVRNKSGKTFYENSLSFILTTTPLKDKMCYRAAPDKTYAAGQIHKSSSLWFVDPQFSMPSEEKTIEKAGLTKQRVLYFY